MHRKVQFGDSCVSEIRALSYLLQHDLIQKFQITSCVIHLGGDGNVSISEMEARRRPSTKDLVSLSNCIQPLLHHLQHEVPERGAKIVPTSVWLRMRHEVGTVKHRDLWHFADDMRPESQPSSACCFCGGPRTSRRASCQRCAGGGMRTLWIPMQDIVDPALHSTLMFEGKEESCGAMTLGDAHWFDGDARHWASPGKEARVSLDVRFVCDFLPRAVVRGANSMQALHLALELLENDRALWQREASNTRFLLSFLDGGAGLEIHVRNALPKDRCAVDARWRRERPLPSVVLDPGEDTDVSTTEAAFVSWIEGNKPPSTVVFSYLTLAARRISECGPVKTTHRKFVRRSQVELILFVTHAIFVVTDYLVRPERWMSPGKSAVCDQIRQWVVEAALKIKFEKDAELWLEVEACARAIAPKEMRLRSGFSPNNPIPSVFWLQSLEDAVVKQEKHRSVRREANDVRLHFRYLIAWRESVLFGL